MNRHWKGFVLRLRGLELSEVTIALTAAGILVNIMLFGVTAILALYAYRQWVAVDKTLVEIKRQTPSVIQSGNAAEQSARIAADQAKSSDESTKATLELMKQQSQAAQTLAKATQDSVATSVKQLEMAERPYLTITDTKLNLSVNHLGFVTYALDVSVDNTGRNPATDTALLGLLGFSPLLKGANIPEMQRRTCHLRDKPGIAGEMVAQEEKQHHLKRFWPGESILEALQNAHVDPTTGIKSTTTVLVECVLYKSPLSKQVHHTALMYDVGISFSHDQAELLERGLMRPEDVIWLTPDQVVIRKQEVMNGLAD